VKRYAFRALLYGVLLWCIAIPAHADDWYGFLVDDVVKPNTNNVHVRTNPGLSSPSLGKVSPTGNLNSAGIIRSGPSYSDGRYWWKVEYTTIDLYGWCAEEFIELWSLRAEEDFAGGYVEVDGVGGSAVNARQYATVDDAVLNTYSEGTIGEVVDGPFQYQAYVWWKIEWPDNIVGWSVQRYLTPYTPPSGDTTPPVITLNGSSHISVAYGAIYTDPWVTATDNVDGTISTWVEQTGLPIDTHSPGTYSVCYNVEDSAGNAASEVCRLVTVLEEHTPPPPPEPEYGDATVFGNALGIGWYDDSWGVSYVTVDGYLEVSFDALGELRFSTDTFDTTGYNVLSLWIRPTDFYEPLYVHVHYADDSFSWDYHVPIVHYTADDALYAHTWQPVRIPLSDLGAENTIITGITFKHDQAVQVGLDDIRFETYTDNDGDICDE